MAWKVNDLKTPRGENLIESFIVKQEQGTKAKITRMILALERYGPNLGMPYSKKIDKDLWELRISGKETVRVFYTVRKNEIILLHIFKKKTEKTPLREIKLARQRLGRF